MNEKQWYIEETDRKTGKKSIEPIRFTGKAVPLKCAKDFQELFGDTTIFKVIPA